MPGRQSSLAEPRREAHRRRPTPGSARPGRSSQSGKPFGRDHVQGDRPRIGRGCQRHRRSLVVRAIARLYPAASGGRLQGAIDRRRGSPRTANSSPSRISRAPTAATATGSPAARQPTRSRATRAKAGKSDLLAQAREPRGQHLRLGRIAGGEGGLQQAQPVGEMEDDLRDHLAAALVAERLAQHQDPAMCRAPRPRATRYDKAPHPCAVPPSPVRRRLAAKRKAALDGRLAAARHAPETARQFRQIDAVRIGAEGPAMEHARPLPPIWCRRYRAWQDRRSPQDIARYARDGRAGPEPQGDDHHLLRQPGADLGDLRQRAGRLLHPPQHRQPRAAARARRPLARHLGGDRVRGDRAQDRASGGHGPPRLRRRARLPRHARRPRADLDTPTSYVGTWLKILKPGFEALAGRGLDYEARIAALEREAVLVSLRNLMSFPFVAEAVAGRPAAAPRRLEGHPRRRTSSSTTPRPAPSRRSEITLC